MTIPFARIYTTGNEVDYVRQAIESGHLCGDGHFTKQCQAWLEAKIGCPKALLTHSCTAALEMSAILADIQPGDEVILPSYTFVSTANAFVLRGGIPIFIDIRPDTLNLDESKIEAAITSRTKAIIPVHYAGVGAQMEAMMAIARSHNLIVIEDAAQGICASHQGQPLGSYGHMAAFSFHSTKNIISGEGGALVINDPQLMQRAEIIWEKGTNRKQFFRVEVDKYTWVDVGSSYLPSDAIAAMLWAQFQQAEAITARRIQIWNDYHEAFAELEVDRGIRRPQIPSASQHNAHIYYLLMKSLEERTQVLSELKNRGIQSTFHYVPLHSSPAGQKFGRLGSSMVVTEDISDRLLRLPLSTSLTDREVQQVIDTVFTVVQGVKRRLKIEGGRQKFQDLEVA
jgi:dTDP-4-amino-4,6-dideoxygalactose transaminase